MDNVIFASYGNDSVALIQWAKENNLSNVAVVYSDTGWAADNWSERVDEMEAWVKHLGFSPYRTSSIGLEELVKQRKGWPRNGMQFCTVELKIKPALKWLDENDPDKKATVLVGVRREESYSRRNFPETLEDSPNHGGRKLWAPLVDTTTIERNELLDRAKVTPLPHRSMECFPCINSNRSDLRLLAKDEKRITDVARVEKELGYTSKGKPRVIFRPAKFMGATGIREVIKWAESERGGYKKDEKEFDCEGGFCET